MKTNREYISLHTLIASLSRSLAQAFSSKDYATASSHLTARYAHFTLTAPLLSATHTPVEIAKGKCHAPLPLALDAFYLKLTPVNSDVIKEATTLDTDTLAKTAMATHTDATASGSAHGAAEPYAAAPSTTQAPARVHFIYRLQAETRKTFQDQNTPQTPPDSNTRQAPDATRPASTNSPMPMPTPCHAKLQRLYINGVRVLWKE